MFTLRNNILSRPRDKTIKIDNSSINIRHGKHDNKIEIIINSSKTPTINKSSSIFRDEKQTNSIENLTRFQ